MTTTSQTQFLSEIAAGHNGPPIPEAKRAYFQARLRNRLFNFILGKFGEQQKNGLTQAALARRIGKKPDVVNRWLGSPGNLTLDTLSDLLLGISAEEFNAASSKLLNRPPAQLFSLGKTSLIVGAVHNDSHECNECHQSRDVANEHSTNRERIGRFKK